MEVYKSLLRDEIDKWMNEMNKHNIIDWVIVVVETYDLRKHNKLLPRTTVFDKIKSDFAEKKADRYVCAIYFIIYPVILILNPYLAVYL